MLDFATPIAERLLVSIEREAIDDHSIQGFVLAASEELVLLQRVHDFHLDGLRLLARCDISHVRCDAACRFQQRLLREEGLESRVPFGLAVDLSDWSAAISNLSRAHSLLLLECERLEEPDFVFGRLVEATPECVHVQCFSVTGDWTEDPVRLDCDQISSFQVDTNYLRFYQRYFERESRSSA